MTVMITPLLTLKLRNKRDVLLARQRARQVAGLLGFVPADKMRIAAWVFQIALNAVKNCRCSLKFQLTDDTLQVFPEAALGTPQDRLDQPLPEGSPGLAPEDVVWLLHELSQLTPLDVFDEIRQQNQELLQALELSAERVGVGIPGTTRRRPAA
jgi:hypothetical protein